MWGCGGDQGVLEGGVETKIHNRLLSVLIKSCLPSAVLNIHSENTRVGALFAWPINRWYSVCCSVIQVVIVVLLTTWSHQYLNQLNL